MTTVIFNEPVFSQNICCSNNSQAFNQVSTYCSGKPKNYWSNSDFYYDNYDHYGELNENNN